MFVLQDKSLNQICASMYFMFAEYEDGKMRLLHKIAQGVGAPDFLQQLVVCNEWDSVNKITTSNCVNDKYNGL